MPNRHENSSQYRYSFNTQEKVDEISGEGNHTTALYWEYDTRLGRRWNQDPKPNPSISNYAAFANNPILFNDVLGDTIRNKHVADYQGKTPDYSYSVGGDAQKVGDYSVTPYYDSDDNLVGYGAAREGQLEYYLDADDLGEFKGNIDNYTLAADLFYMNGVPSEGMIAMVAGDTWKGLKMQWGDALQDPQYVASLALAFGHSAVMMGGARNAASRNLKYDSRIRQRAIEGGSAHNFPYSYDNYIIQNGTMTRVSDSYTIYRLKGSMINEVNQGSLSTPLRIKEGVYEIGIQNGTVTHRTFTTGGGH